MAHGLQTAMNFQFLVTLLFWDKIMKIIHSLSLYLQSKRNDLIRIAALFRDVISEFQRLRSDDEFDKIVLAAHDYWTQLELGEEAANFKQVRVRKRKRMAGEQTSDERPEDEKYSFKVNAYFVCLDAMIQELTQRLIGLENTSELFNFLQPSIFKHISDESINKQVELIITTFPQDFSMSLCTELKNFKRLYFSDTTDSRDKNKDQFGVLPYLQYLVDKQISDAYPEVEILLRLFLTLPIGISSAERSFSVVRRLKTYLRSSMGNEMLSQLGILCIERSTASTLNFEARRGIKL